MILGVITAIAFSLDVRLCQEFVPVFNISNFSSQGQSGTLFYHDASQLKMFEGPPFSMKKGESVSPPK